MNEVDLINMMSYLDRDLFEDEYIETDMNSLNNSSSIIIAGVLVLLGIIAIVINKKRRIKFSRKSPKLARKIYNIVIN